LNDRSWSTFNRYLYTADMPDPDLVIRTSGETRISNFLLMQAAYAEFIFTPVLWPDFTKADLAAAIAEYAQRERRYGLTSEQVRPAAAAK
jgi:undecaprenyl diphosphate synthase